jgi:hypothetical protein
MSQGYDTDLLQKRVAHAQKHVEDPKMPSSPPNFEIELHIFL